jgi:hypothetical protein
MRTHFLSLAPCLPLLLATGSGPVAQESVSATSPIVLKLCGEGVKPLDLTAAQLAELPRIAVTARAHDGKESRYEGVALVEFLRKAGLPGGEDLRGEALARFLVVEAADGYRAVFAIPELDPAFTDRVVLLADRRDGRPLDAREGTFQVIVPGDKRHSRWVRQVVRLRVGRA